MSRYSSVAQLPFPMTVWVNVSPLLVHERWQGEKVSICRHWTGTVMPVALPCQSISMGVSGFPSGGGKRHCVLDLVGLLVLQPLFLTVLIHIIWAPKSYYRATVRKNLGWKIRSHCSGLYLPLLVHFPGEYHSPSKMTLCGQGSWQFATAWNYRLLTSNVVDNTFSP